MSNHDDNTPDSKPTTTVPCCPELKPCAVCDTLNFTYRLPFRPVVTAANQRTPVPVEVTLHFRLTRCAGPLSLGDPVYTTTLLPGEQVKLASSDRHTRFSYDKETSLSYRNEATSEESFYAAGMAYGMSNLDALDTTHTDSSFSSDSVSGGGGAGINLFGIHIGGSVAASSYDAQSASSFAHSLSRHSQSLQSHMEVSTHAAASTSIGEVATREHQQGESQDQYEAATRTFSNPNHCHALTFFFYRINKCQTVKFELVGIERHVADPAAPTSAVLNPPKPATGVAIHSNAVLATAKARLDVAQRALESVAVERGGNQINSFGSSRLFTSSTHFLREEPIPMEIRQAALAMVDKELVKEGLLDKPDGVVSRSLQKELSWEREMTIPTPGVMVKGCLDDCDICEPEVQKKTQLELTHLDLQNQLLQRQIELLDKAQEYRCCPPSLPE